MKASIGTLAVLAASSLALRVLVGCGASSEGSSSDALAQCNEGVAASCARIYDCFSAAQLKAAAALVGSDEAECRQNNQDLFCSEPCDSSRTWDSAKGRECIDQIETTSCSELSVTSLPPACDERCR